MEQAHNTDLLLLDYNNETELTAVVNLVYLAARDYYRAEREYAGRIFAVGIDYDRKKKKQACKIEVLK